MGVILLPQRFQQQPPYNAPLNPDWVARGLVVACNPAVGAYNQVTRQLVTNSGGMGFTPTPSGKSWQGGASKFIDFGATYAPGSRGATVIQVVNPGTSANVFSLSSRAGSGSSGIEILIGNGGVAGLARARLDTVAITSDVTGLNDNRDHVLTVRYTPSTELKIWADHFGKSSGITSSIPASITPDQNLRLHSRGATYYTGKSGLTLYFDNPLSDADVATLLQNPNVVYQWKHRRIWVSTSGGGPIIYNQSLAGSLTPAGALTKRTLKVNGGFLSMSGGLVKKTSKAYTGSLTAAGAVAKRTTKAFAGSVAGSGALSTMILFTASLAGSLTPAGALSKMTLKTLSGSSTLAGAITKKTFRTLDGNVTVAGALTKLTKIAMAGSATVAGALTETYSVLKTLTGSITPAGALATAYIAFVAGVLKMLSLLGVGQ